MIVITRPSPAGTTLAHAIHDAGYTSLHLPGLKIDPIIPSQTEQAIAWQADWWLFPSPAAIQYTSHWVNNSLTFHVTAQTAWPSIAVLSEISAERLRQAFQWSNNPTPIIWPETGFRSEHLLTHTQLQNIVGQRVVIFNASGGRPLLKSTLLERGALVDEIQVYHRAPSMLDNTVLQELDNWQGKRLTLWTSNTAIQHLKQQLSEPQWKKLVFGDHLLLSNRQKSALSDHGTGKMFLAEAPDNDSLKKQLIKLYQQ